MKFYPEIPRPPSRIIPYLSEPAELGEGGIFWSYKTFNEPSNVKLNKGCNNVSKTRVTDIWEMVSGYQLRVYPESYQGIAIEKGEDHDHSGRFVKCPTKPKQHKVYQRLIDARISSTQTSELRVFWCLGMIDFVIEKIKTDIFSYTKDKVIFHEPQEVLKRGEIEMIRTFCAAFGLDFGELDILRHSDGRIYIIDVNNIPGAGGALEPFPEAKERYRKQVKRIEKYCK